MIIFIVVIMVMVMVIMVVVMVIMVMVIMIMVMIVVFIIPSVVIVVMPGRPLLFIPIIQVVRIMSIPWGPYLNDVYIIFGILDPPLIVCILATSIVLNPHNLPYYVCIWVTIPHLSV